MRRVPSIPILVAAVLVALVAVVASAAMPVNKHTFVANWTCANGGTYANLINWTSSHKLTFWTADGGTPARLEQLSEYETDTYVVADGPTVTTTWFQDLGEVGQGGYHAGKIFGPCQTTLVFPFAGVVDPLVVSWLPELAPYIGQPYTGTTSLELHALFFVPQL